MERIGFIGVGEIAKAMVEGLCDGVADPPQVNLSPRGAGIAAELAGRFPTARVRAGNQEVVDESDIVVIALRRTDRHEALAGIAIGAEKTVVNLMPGVANDDLRAQLGTDADLVSAIPLPTVRERGSVTITYPANPVADALFDRLGGAQPVADETRYNVCSALASTLTSNYAYLTALTDWAARNGLPPEVADRYLRSLYQGVGRSLGDESRTLHQIAADHETPGGSNERVRTTWFEPVKDGLGRALDGLLADLERPEG